MLLKFNWKATVIHRFDIIENPLNTLDILVQINYYIYQNKTYITVVYAIWQLNKNYAATFLKQHL